jgi:hypothetical protein
MRDEGYRPIDSQRFGPLAFLRKKQWWSFEGLDPRQKLYYVFLALQAIPSDYISLKVIDYENNQRWTEDHLGSFQTAPGDAVDVTAAGKWGQLRFAGRAEEGWQVDIQTPRLTLHCVQKPQAPVHRNWLLTQHIDYTIQQFVMNEAQGTLRFEGQDHAFSGYGYHEHNWGVQPRHSTALWLHFWCPETAGVVLSCHYDAGVPHHYTYLWCQGQPVALHSPAQFTFDPAHPEAPWEVHAPDLDLCLRPIDAHHSQMQIPPLIAYISTDYYEQLLEVEGTAWVHGQPKSIQGLGKFDFNWNRW